MRPFLILLLIFATVSACNNSSEESIMKAEATLRWTGDYAADGCGFFIVINNEEFKPVNEAFLDDHFKQETDQKIYLEYVELLNEREIQCGMNPEPIEVQLVEVITVKRL